MALLSRNSINITLSLVSPYDINVTHPLVSRYTKRHFQEQPPLSNMFQNLITDFLFKPSSFNYYTKLKSINLFGQVIIVAAYFQSNPLLVLY